MSHIVVNCRKVHFATTLGVPHALLRLCAALADDHELTFVVNDLDTTVCGPAGEAIRTIAAEVIDVDDVRSISDRVRWSAIELLPHHFQPPELCERSIMMCHDLHAFDTPWRYGDGDRATRIQDSFRRNLLAASAVMAHFPRTYYAVEHAAGITIRNLFLTESPLLLDVQPRPGDPVPEPAPAHAIRRLLYPGQLQLHKNHEGLARGVAELRRRGVSVGVVCPGSDFDTDLTAHVRSLLGELGVADLFEFPGRVSDDVLIGLYRSCDGVIVPSVAEGGAYVPLEAIASGKPVAVNEIDAAKMHLDSMHGHVIWFDADDSASTADALQQLSDADALDWFHKNTGCRERIAAATWQSVASRWNSVIGMLEGVRARPIVGIDRHASEIVYS